MADVKVLEHSTLKVPYEILNKKFRAAQKNIDREVSKVGVAASDLENCLRSTTDVSQVTTLLDSVVDKLSALKRKADESTTEELDTARLCKRRLEHLKDYEKFTPNVAATWKKKRLDRMMVEYFLRCGFYQTALKLAQHSDITDLTNIDLFLVSKEVEDSLGEGETSKCLAWCADNKSKLRKLKSTLEFSLREQEFIELIRNNQRMDAIRHARKYFSSVEDSHLLRVQKVMGLLACPIDTKIKDYQDLLNTTRWIGLVEQFRYENFKLHQLSSDSIFVVTLQAGLSALKTPHCYKVDGEAKNKNCPVCSTNLNELAKELPYSHCAQSKLICYISGLPLNEHNPPMMLPNGFVYGYNALATMASLNEGQVVCPRTKEIYGIEEAEKVFVM